VPDEAVWERLIDALDQTGARYAIPHSTWTLPMANASGAKSMRLLPGTSFWHANKALETRKPQYPVLEYDHASPLLAGCALENLDARNDAIAVADNCYVFLQGDQPCVPSPVWNRQAHDARMWIDEHRSTDPAVVLFTSNVGPWGGVACLLRVAEQLCAYGLNAQVLHFTTNKHRFNPGVGPIQVTRPHQLTKTLDAVTRAERGVLFATHWWGEELLTPIWRANPKWDRAAYWQDREDMFTNKKGEHTLTKEQAEKYASVPNRVINATWVRDTAETDLGIDESTVIPVGYDHTIFYPPEVERSDEGPVRILAMYRPTTPRRGDKTLLALYRDLRKHFKGDVVLQVFGEKPPVSADVDQYLGWLSETEVADAMRRAHIVIEPSEFQGFGLPGLEALATGAALVSTDNRGIHEYGEHGRNCLIARTYNELFFHTVNLVQNPDLRKQLGETALEAAPRFSWPVIGAEWVCWLERFPCIAEAYRDSIARAKEDLRAYRDRTQCVLGLSRYTSYP
jgi:glycosyltransferase involved in cell wall biosynthesis